MCTKCSDITYKAVIYNIAHKRERKCAENLDTINLFFLTAISIFLILNHNTSRLLIDKIDSAYFIWKKISFYFSDGNGQPREPALCQLYRHTFVPYGQQKPHLKRNFNYFVAYTRTGQLLLLLQVVLSDCYYRAFVMNTACVAVLLSSGPRLARAYSKEFFGVHNFKSSCMM